MPTRFSQTAPNRWVLLCVGMAAQAIGAVAANAAVFLIPYLHAERGLSLAQAGALASAAIIGTGVSLVAWGLLVDHLGEHLTLVAGMTITAAATAAATFADGYPSLAACWFVAGVGVASTNAASGRLVVGWFPPERRGVAMGIRQTALPLGMGFAAVFVPVMVHRTDLRTTLLSIVAMCVAALIACAVFVVDPPRVPRAEVIDPAVLANPYRGSSTLVRIHIASALLVIPQFTVWSYMLVWLIDDRSWTAGLAGGLVAVTQLLGSAGRIGVGWWSDQVGSRLVPLRHVAIAAFATMLLLGLLEPTPLAIALIVIATVVTVADNGLAFTSVAEIGGPYWAGRTIGLQNTGQYLVSAAVPPGVGLLVTHAGYGWAFGVVAVFPLLAIGLVPRDESA